MTVEELANSAAPDAAPPAGISDEARALWFAKAGRWEQAHDLCQEIESPSGYWIHAYLHRVEGDLSNAAYWYARAGRPAPSRSKTLEIEWLEIAAAFV